MQQRTSTSPTPSPTVARPMPTCGGRWCMTEPLEQCCGTCHRFGHAPYGGAGWCGLLHEWREPQDSCEDYIKEDDDQDDEEDDNDG